MKAGTWYAGLLTLALMTLALTHVATFQELGPVSDWFFSLLIANVTLIVIMLIVVITVAVRLWRAWRRDSAGSRLSVRLAGLFLVTAMVPATALYLVSASGVFRGIESWFATPLDRAFEKGMAFGQYILRQEFSRLEETARNIANEVGSGRRSLPFWLDDLRLLYQLDEVELFDVHGRPLGNSLGGNLERAVLESLREKSVHHTVSSLGNLRRDLQVSVIMPYQRSGYALRVSRALPEGIADGLGEIERGRHEYEKLLILRRGLLLSFMATLTLSFVMVLATALWVSLRLGLQLVKPLVKITAAAQAVGRGDFNQRLPAGNQEDEIAKLSHAFNSMVDDLDRSQQQVSERQAALSEANTSLENLLSSLTAGVLVLDGQGRLIRANRSAEQLLKISLVSFVGLHVDNWAGMDSLAAMIKKITASGVASAEHRLSQDEEGRTLLVRLRQLTTIAGGLLVVVDDISGQLQAERDAIWEEASQRFAHEIKNPLTPIQLAAERLENKLGGKLETDDAELLSRMSTTITNQVTAMREMVDSFRSYANNQRRRMKATDLNQLAAEVAQLYEYPGLTLQLKWDEKLPAVAGDALLLRQVLHNLLGNASDAVLDKPSPHIVVQTSVADEYAQLSIEDNGGGVAENLIDQVFSPYVTTKTQGTGLGLAVVRKVMEEHGGEARLENVNNGARMLLRIPLWQQGNGN